MSTEGGRAVVTARVAGRPRRLATEKQWRAAIAGGDLKPEDPVDYEAPGCTPASRVAGEVPELQALFSELLPGFDEWRRPADPPPVAPQTSPDQVEQGQTDTGEEGSAMAQAAPAASAPLVAQTRTTGKPAKRAPSGTASPLSGGAGRERGTSTASLPILIGGGVIAVILFAVLVFGGSDSEGDPAGQSTAAQVASGPDGSESEETADQSDPGIAAPTPTPTPNARELALRERQRLQREARSTPTPAPTIVPTFTPPPPPPAVSQARAVQPRNLSRWANRIGSDYPRRAAQRGEQGTVGFRVTVAPNGRVEACEITSSSGSAELDRAACQGVSRHARFDPALNDAGEPIAASWSSAITYRLD